MDATSPSANHGTSAQPDDDTPAQEQPERQLAAAQAQVDGRLERRRAATSPPKPDERRNGRAPAMTAMAHGVRARQPRHAAAAGEHHEDHRGDGHVDGARRRAEARVERGEPARQRPVGRSTVEHLLGVGQAACAAGSSTSTAAAASSERQQVARPRGPGQVLREPASGALIQRACSAERARARRTGTCRASSPRARRGASGGRAPQRVHARRRELVGRARQRLAAADHRQRQREPSR